MVKYQKMQKEEIKVLPIVFLIILSVILMGLLVFTVLVFSVSRQTERIIEARTADCYRFHACESLDSCPTEQGPMKCDFIGIDNPNYADCLERRKNCLSNPK